MIENVEVLYFVSNGDDALSATYSGLAMDQSQVIVFTVSIKLP